MKLIILTSLMAISSALYTDVDDKIDINEIDNNSTELRNFLNCYLDKEPCNDTMNSYKKHFNEVFHNKCADCSPLQKHIGEEFIKTALMKYPELVKQLQLKYDPEGKDFKALLEELAKY